MHEQTLEQRVRRLEDERDIETSMYLYGASLDCGYDIAKIRAVFTDDARWSAPGFGTFSGIDAICAFFSSLSDSVVTALHYIGSPRISVDPDRQAANGSFYLLCLSRSRNRHDRSLVEPFATLGTYDVRFRNVGERWLVGDMHVNIVHVAQLAGFQAQ